LEIVTNRSAIESYHRGYESLNVVLSALESSLNYMDPKRLVNKRVKVKGSTLLIRCPAQHKTLHMNLNNFDSIYLVGAGKAASKMSDTLCAILDRRISGGAINVPYMGNIEINNKICVTQANHPIPDKAGVNGTKKIINILRKTRQSDLVFVLISGGASALMPLPADGITLSDKQRITNEMMSCGASIHEINVVRKHISKVKGGQLLRFINRGCIVISLILSDVIGDEIETIASGPTVPDKSTFKDAAMILKKYGLWTNKVENRSAISLISRGLKGTIEDTPKASNPIFSKVYNILIGNNTLLCNKATQYLRSRGLEAANLGSSFDGEAREFGLLLARLADEIRKPSKPFAYILGGETTVKLNKTRKNGLGGRNQEAVLAAALESTFLNTDDITIICMGTDGIDGNSTAAGAFATPKTVSLVKQDEIQMKKHLSRHNSYNALKKICSLIVTGRTGTNVNDISIVCSLK
jgi:glycerate 2-kinase